MDSTAGIRRKHDHHLRGVANINGDISKNSAPSLVVRTGCGGRGAAGILDYRKTRKKAPGSNHGDELL